MRLAVVTATTDAMRAADCVRSWRDNALERTLLVVGVINNPLKMEPAPHGWGVFDVALQMADYAGSVPAFEVGVNHLLGWEEPPDIIACLHDDFRIDEPRWDDKVIKHFDRHRSCGLLGFGGAKGLGSDDLYQVPYDPMQLARIGFRSNLQDAELHGMRSMLPERVACLDGFSQIGRLDFWNGYRLTADKRIRYRTEDRPWTVLTELGFVHHFYDGALGAIAKRYGWETWYLPLRGHHFGGRTAVGDQGYAAWAQSQTTGGDAGFWARAHRIGYDAFRDELPIRL